MKILPCPFCGNEAGDGEEGVRVGHWFEILNQTNMAAVECNHCGAAGGSFGSDIREEAEALAIAAWNNAGRPNWWQRNVTRRYIQLRYNISMFKEAE